MNDNTFFFWLNVVANACQLESYEMLIRETKNDELMNYLRHQDNDYLKTIVSQNEEIIKLLKEKNDAH